jgi:hypothetical protein
MAWDIFHISMGFVGGVCMGGLVVGGGSSYEVAESRVGRGVCVIAAACKFAGADVVFGSSRQRPNQPGVSQVVVVVVDVREEEKVVVVVVVSSKQPHQPGVLQVDVRVLVFVADVVVVRVVVGRELLLS